MGGEFHLGTPAFGIETAFMTTGEYACWCRMDGYLQVPGNLLEEDCELFKRSDEVAHLSLGEVWHRLGLADAAVTLARVGNRPPTGCVYVMAKPLPKRPIGEGASPAAIPALVSGWCFSDRGVNGVFYVVSALD